MSVKSKILQQQRGLRIRSTNLQQHQQEAQLKVIAVQRTAVVQPAKEKHCRRNSVWDWSRTWRWNYVPGNYGASSTPLVQKWSLRRLAGTYDSESSTETGLNSVAYGTPLIHYDKIIYNSLACRRIYVIRGQCIRVDIRIGFRDRLLWKWYLYLACIRLKIYLQ